MKTFSITCFAPTEFVLSLNRVFNYHPHCVPDLLNIDNNAIALIIPIVRITLCILSLTNMSSLRNRIIIIFLWNHLLYNQGNILSCICQCHIIKHQFAVAAKCFIRKHKMISQTRFVWHCFMFYTMAYDYISALVVTVRGNEITPLIEK